MDLSVSEEKMSACPVLLHAWSCLVSTGFISVFRGGFRPIPIPQAQAVSDREGFSARVQQVGVWCRCVAFFWPVLPHFPSVLLCSQPRFPACSCQLSCSLLMLLEHARSNDFDWLSNYDYFAILWASALHQPQTTRTARTKHTHLPTRPRLVRPVRSSQSQS